MLQRIGRVGFNGLFIVVLSSLLYETSVAIRLLELKVPLHATRGDSATLSCKFDLERDVLYSVKWYKDLHEFFRFMPGDNPPSRTFPVAGIQPDLSQSNENQVVLKDLSLNSSGTYRCEVSADGPSFQTVAGNSDMNVIAIPDGPKITGLKSTYNVGEILTANCTARRAKPAASLTWYINDNQAVPKFLDEYPPHADREGLETTNLGLRFRVEQRHFRRGALHVRCSAAIGTMFWKNDEAIVYLETANMQEKLSRQKKYSSCSGFPRSDMWLTCVILVLTAIVRRCQPS